MLTQDIAPKLLYAITPGAPLEAVRRLDHAWFEPLTALATDITKLGNGSSLWRFNRRQMRVSIFG